MMETTSSSTRNYVDDFNPLEYYQTYYAPGKGIFTEGWTNFVLRNLHETFTTGGVEGDTLIDIGAGPTIYHLLSACEVFNTIITSDFLETNCNELKKWLEKDPKALDWNSVIQFVCELEGNRQTFEEKTEKLRSKVKRVLRCNVLKSNPFHPISLPPADCLLCCLCLESSCKDLKTYSNALKGFQNLIKPGGHLLVLSNLNASFYHVGEKQFRVLTVIKTDLETTFKEAGFEIERMVFAPRRDTSSLDICDFKSHYYVHARKPK